MARVMSHSAELGARYQLYAATAPDARGSEYYNPRLVLLGPVARFKLPAAAKNTVAAARLWELSERLTGVHFEFQSQAQKQSFS